MTTAEDLARVYDRKEREALAANRQREQQVHGPWANQYQRPAEIDPVTPFALGAFIVVCAGIAVAIVWSLGK